MSRQTEHTAALFAFVVLKLFTRRSVEVVHLDPERVTLPRSVCL